MNTVIVLKVLGRVVAGVGLLTTLLDTPAEASSASNRPAQEIRDLVRANFDVFRGCFEVLLQTEPQASGSFVSSFFITPAGIVTDVAEAAGSTLDDANFGRCILDGFASLRFNANADSQPTSVTYPLAFSPE